MHNNNIQSSVLFCHFLQKNGLSLFVLLSLVSRYVTLKIVENVSTVIAVTHVVIDTKLPSPIMHHSRQTTRQLNRRRVGRSTAGQRGRQ